MFSSMYKKNFTKKEKTKIAIFILIILISVVITTVVIKIKTNIHRSPEALVKAYEASIYNTDYNEMVKCYPEGPVEKATEDAMQYSQFEADKNVALVKSFNNISYGSGWYSSIRIEQGPIKNNMCIVTVTYSNKAKNIITTKKDNKLGWIIVNTQP